MGISPRIALEIYANPDDLEIELPRRNPSGEYAIVISRGPGDYHRLLLNSKTCMATQEAAIEIVLEILCIIHLFGNIKIEVSGRILEIYSHERMPAILTAEHIDKIEAALRANGSAKTWELFPAS